jgi:catechol O-methyltransferase
MLLGMWSLTRNWQVGDGREEALAAHVLAHARPGDLDDAIRVIDEFCATRSVMMNVGDEKGEILDGAVRRVAPRLLLELGTYCGYSGLRIARVMPAGARFYSIEFLPANAEIARSIWAHAGVGDRLNVVVGSLGGGGATIERLRRDFGFTDGALDFVFVDHDKRFYLPDLERIQQERGCIPARWWSRTTSRFRVRPSTGPACGLARARRGARSSTTRTSSISRSSRT